MSMVLAMKSIENSKLFDKAEKAGMNTQDVFDAMSGHGIFMLVLSRPIAKEKLLNTYYTRQQIEQIFDLCKNYVFCQAKILGLITRESRCLISGISRD